MNTRQQRHRSGNEKWAKLQSNFTHTLFETREKQRQTYALAHNSHTHMTRTGRYSNYIRSSRSKIVCFVCGFLLLCLLDICQIHCQYCLSFVTSLSFSRFNQFRSILSLCVCADVVFTVIYMFHSNL